MVVQRKYPFSKGKTVNKKTLPEADISMFDEISDMSAIALQERVLCQSDEIRDLELRLDELTEILCDLANADCPEDTEELLRVVRSRFGEQQDQLPF